MTTVKLSYSILNAWASGHQEDAVGYYLGKDMPPTPQMELGRAKDDLWTAEILKNNEIPAELGRGKLKAPIVQKLYSMIIPLGGDMQILLRGKPDLVDDQVIRDWKCGKTEPAQYLDSMQLDYYSLFEPTAHTGIYHCFNPYTKTVRLGIKFLDQKNRDAALEHIITFGSEMINYLQVEKLLRNYEG